MKVETMTLSPGTRLCDTFIGMAVSSIKLQATVYIMQICGGKLSQLQRIVKIYKNFSVVSFIPY